MALRRSKPFLAAFPLIDAAIEGAGAGGVLSRDEFRSARARIVELLCDAADDDEKVEGFCELLDEAMAGSLATLRAVSPEKIELASGDLVGAVGALMKDHPSERVRELARDVVRGWRAGVKAELARAKAAMDVLDGLSSTPPPPLRDETAPMADSNTTAKKIPEEPPRPRKSTVSSSCRRISTAESKKGAPIVGTSNAKPSANMGAPAEEEKMEATKRKLHERYQEAEDAKRRRTIQVIEPPRPPPGMNKGQMQRNAHPARCAAERCFVKSSTLGMRV
ncbi:probable mediator of RNA polymerase II transcription subunit 26c [Panicum hallii]|uniref:probable mediator of RNA polymerase II transcription subunit 26c n=1 Tax=Panicum hallii TaxID=206008 RepID=UPI000DF4EE61|nr:probable mediator of RNA polymerase II transcription subunit 26c [Panicum hallii]